jgi:ferredoxin
MDAELRTQLAFHATGKRSGSLEPVEVPQLRPALFVGYRDLAKLRYDFPLVLAHPKGDEPWVRSLTGIVDAILQKIAPRGVEGERTRRQVLRLEQEIRRRAGEKGAGKLSALWDEAVAALIAKSNEDLSESFQRARAALAADGDVADCDAALPARLFTHAWRTVQERRLHGLAERIERLVLKLSDVMVADFARSESGRSPAALAAAMGPVFAGEFDFSAMARVIGSAASKGALPESRRLRIEHTLQVLRDQPFLAGARKHDMTEALRDFAFDDCYAALAAYRAKLPAIVDLVRAITIAELEIEGRYVEAEHDAFFASFDQGSLGRDDLALFPDVLVCLRTADGRAEQQAGIMAVLSSGLPIKVLAQSDDILGEPQAGQGAFSFAVARLGTMAVGLNDVYVLQASAANLYALRERISRGLMFPGAALFSVFSGAGKEGELPPYLASAAAMQSRTFPAFCYDPAAGADLASRFALEENPQPDADWPRHGFTYEDEAHQRVAKDLFFTFVDFVASDRRFAGHFARVPAGKGNGAMIPVGEWLDAEPAAVAEKVPYILMVDGADGLHRSIADEALTTAARRCRDMWHRLQELGGIHNSYAERLLAKEKKAWEEQRQREAAVAAKVEAPAPATAAAAAPAAAPAAPAAPAAAEAAPEQKSDDPYIETLRCTSCNECTNLNPRMFQYNENKQAFIADPNAGTYRQLVEAAENCQVSIIHPGKPRNPNEPDLAELIKRAEPFN